VRALSFDDLIRHVLVPVELPAETSQRLGAAGPVVRSATAPSRAHVTPPSLRYTKTSDGVTIAYTTFGDGPSLIWLPSFPFSNIAGQWRVPRYRDAYERLARHLRIILYDARGCGDSTRDVEDLGLGAMIRDLEAVLDQTDGDRVTLFGNYSSSPVAIAYAARNPGRVNSLILLGGPSWHEYQEGGALRQFQALSPIIDRDWDVFINSLVRVWVGWSAGEEGRLVAEAFRNGVTSEMAKRTIEALSQIDATADLAKITVPTLVLHREGYPEIPLEISRRIAEALPDGRLLRLGGASAGFLFEEGDADVLLDFLTAEPGGPISLGARS
jgi:pimeloyl-ACP methyl ester carboxylesterase